MGTNLNIITRRILGFLKNFYSLTRSAPEQIVYFPWRLAAVLWTRLLQKGKEKSVGSFAYDLEPLPDDIFRSQDIQFLFPPFRQTRPISRPFRMASILDEFSDYGFRYEANLVRITPDRWREQIREEKPDILLIESAWRGNSGVWRKKIENCTAVPGNPLIELIEHCHSNSIPVVMWNKEDPPNYEHFKDLAPLTDFVFTSDRESIPNYKKLVQHDRIAALPFAIQPKIHNPIGKRDHPLLEVCFAGTWYNHKHHDRKELLPRLLDGATHRQLHIFDRRAQSLNPSYRFPRRYTPFLHDPLPYSQMLQAYRDFRLFLNVNSVTDSSTMFARRVLEVLACQTNVVSTPSLGVQKMLGDVVHISDCTDEIRAMVDSVLDDDIGRMRRGHLGWRKVIREHTYSHRMRTIVSAVGVSLPQNLSTTPQVSLLVRHHPSGNLPLLLENIDAQTYDNLEVLFIEESRNEANDNVRRYIDNCPNSRIMSLPHFEQHPNICLQQLSSVASGDLITLFDSRDLHSPQLVWDMFSSLSCTDCDIVTKLGYFEWESGRLSIKDPTLMYRQKQKASLRIFMARRERLQNKTTWKVNNEMFLVPDNSIDNKDFSYSTDPFGFILNGARIGFSPQKHSSDTRIVHPAFI